MGYIKKMDRNTGSKLTFRKKNAPKAKAVALQTIDNLPEIENISKIGNPLKNQLHERFCLYYSVTLNAVDSYLKAKKDILEYSKKGKIALEDIDVKEDTKKIHGKIITNINYSTAGAVSSTLLNKIDIQTRLQELSDYTAKRLLINKSDIIQGLQHEINSDPIDVFEWTKGGSLIIKDIYDIPRHVRMTIKSVKQTEKGQIEISFCDKQRARELLMKHLGMLNDQSSINVTLDLGSRLAEAHQRVLNIRTAARNKGLEIPADYEEIPEEN